MPMPKARAKVPASRAPPSRPQAPTRARSGLGQPASEGGSGELNTYEEQPSSLKRARPAPFGKDTFQEVIVGNMNTPVVSTLESESDDATAPARSHSGHSGQVCLMRSHLAPACPFSTLSECSIHVVQCTVHNSHASHAQHK